MEGGFLFVLLGQVLLQKILLCSCVVFIPLGVCVCHVLRSLSSVPRMGHCASAFACPQWSCSCSLDYLFVCLFVQLFIKKVKMTI